MEQFVRELVRQLEIELLEVRPGKEPLSVEKQHTLLAGKAVIELRRKLQDHIFATVEEEVRFFKELAPPLYAKLFTNQKMYRIAAECIGASEEHVEAVITAETMDINLFRSDYAEFHQYYSLQHTHRDREFFTGKGWEDVIVEDVNMLLERANCPASIWIGWILANNTIRFCLDDIRQAQMERLRNERSIGAIKPIVKLQFTAGPTDFAELMYALFVTGCINNGNTDIKELVRSFSAFLSIDPGDVYMRFQEAARRKNSRTKFIDEMRNGLIRRMDQRDELQ